MTTLARLLRQRVIPVLRSADAQDAIDTALALAEGGLEVVELTLTTPDVHTAVAELRDRGLEVGLGTLTDAREVEPAAAAGASFVVSFAHPPGFVAAATDRGLLAIPAALTPTELLAARREGAALVKLFPADSVGPRYARHIRTVLPDLALIATGGISTDPADIASWLDAGVAAVGIGSALGTVAADGRAEVVRRASTLARVYRTAP